MVRDRHVSLVMGSRLDYLDAVHALAEEMGKLAGLEESDRFNFALAMREAATNAVTHGNGADPARKVEVDFFLTGGALEGRIRDEGAGFEFTGAADPRLPEHRFRTSGRGLLLMRKFVDEVTYNHGSRKGTEIRLVKKLGG